MDKKLRDEAKKIAQELGVPLTTVMNAMTRQFVRDRRLVLEAECPFPGHTPNAETRRALQAGRRSTKGDKVFTSIEEVQEYVRSL